MLTINTKLGKIRFNRFTKKHAAHGKHQDPTLNRSLHNALSNNRYQVVNETKSGWKGRAVKNVILLVKTASETLIVVVKQISKNELILVTAYCPRIHQLRKLQQAQY